MIRLSAENRTPDDLRGGIIAIGNFDGFHRGHQAVARHAIDWAKSEGRPAIIATFEPHPIRHFRPDAPPFRLTTIDQRAALFAAAGADAMLVFRFDAALAAVTAEQFITDWLIDRAGASGTVTGEDFNFGKGRQGSAAMLRDFGAAHGLSAHALGPVLDNGVPVSSSRVRDALTNGDVATATRLLTRPFAITGTVQHGDKVGRTLGFPTANLMLGDYLRPKYGIYAVRGHTDDGRVLGGVANLGIRPSFDPPKELLEPHFFDFDGDLYGRELSVELIGFLRGEARFDSLDALKVQMRADADAARALLDQA